MILRDFSDCNSNAVQAIRIAVDVLFLGPLLIWLGLNKSTGLPQGVRLLLIVTGVLTILFNGINFLIIEQQKRIQGEI